MYSLQFLQIPAGMDPLETARKMMQQDDDDTLDELKDLDLDRMAAAIKRVWPELCLDDDEYEGSRTITFTEPEGGTDLEIEIFDAGALIGLPSASEIPLTEDFWSRLWKCAESLEFHGGLVVYDPQLDRILDLQRDQAAVRESWKSQS